MPIDFQTLMYIALAILFLVFSGARRRKAAERTPPPRTDEQEPIHANTEVNVPSESEVVLPPFMQNFEGSDPDVGTLQETIESEVEGLPMETEQVVPETELAPEPEAKPIEPPPVPVDSPVNLPTKPLPATSLIEISPETFRQGIILSEILGRPKGLRNRQ